MVRRCKAAREAWWLTYSCCVSYRLSLPHFREHIKLYSVEMRNLVVLSLFSCFLLTPCDSKTCKKKDCPKNRTDYYNKYLCTNAVNISFKQLTWRGKSCCSQNVSCDSSLSFVILCCTGIHPKFVVTAGGASVAIVAIIFLGFTGYYCFRCRRRETTMDTVTVSYAPCSFSSPSRSSHEQTLSNAWFRYYLKCCQSGRFCRSDNSGILVYNLLLRNVLSKWFVVICSLNHTHAKKCFLC